MDDPTKVALNRLLDEHHQALTAALGAVLDIDAGLREILRTGKESSLDGPSDTP
ncbi:hypothetical protein [Streptomyces coffeae]|uniref:Uncharacterized protein n=1 Tax=Streptomyces coffeae TaxID=621382 RepID=A0ABS1N510_9ACTN|nr:hypothetical protein [Streptomyces coffeae]MBL1095162.1 hypothetical protein [Streptomyces coffeae]